MATGSVAVVLLVRFSAIGNSFQLKMNTSNPVATRPGATEADSGPSANGVQPTEADIRLHAVCGLESE